MERETKKFKTSGGTEYEIKTYLTFKEARELQSVYLDNADLVAGADGSHVPSVKGNVARLAQDKSIEITLVSINGKTSNVLDELEKMKAHEATEIIDQINKIQDPITEEKKTK